MRLTDLTPRWQSDDGRRVGVTFDCPGTCCAGKPSARDLFDACERAGETKIIISVPFKTDTDGKPYREDGWERTGDTFDTLTLLPSIDALDGHWHGFVTSGAIVNA